MEKTIAPIEDKMKYYKEDKLELQKKHASARFIIEKTTYEERNLTYSVFISELQEILQSLKKEKV